jgi:hypothetical protein
MYEGPHPFTGGASNRVQTFHYDLQGRLIRSGTDSFVYNNSNQIIKRYRQLSSDPSRSFYVNSFTYDTNGRLVIDSIFTGKTIANPAERMVTTSILYTYDNNNNLIKQDWINFSQVNPTHFIINNQFDNSPNPFNKNAYVMYMAGAEPPVISTNNVSKAGYVYEYYSNGYLKKISYQGFIQEFFYE